MPVHHLPNELLLDHAAGSMSEPVALLVSTHLALCPSCREAAVRLDSVGGALLQEIEPEPIEAGGVDALFARIEAGPPAPAAALPADPDAAPDKTAQGKPTLPRPLRDYVAGGLDDLAWQRRGGLTEARVMDGEGGAAVKLLRIPAGVTMPAHGHRASELTLVLEGGFSDEHGHYLRGDVALADETMSHQPRADEDGTCLCLTVTEAPVRLTGRLARLFNPFIRH